MEKVLRVLMLEDTPADAELLEHMLRKAALAFIARRVDTESAFKRALEDFRPDIVLADYRLPAYDGLAAIEYAHQCYPDLPVIMVTGALGEEKAIELLRAGARDYILKDRLTRLPAAILRVLAEQKEIQARRVAENSLRESEERIRQILDSALEAVIGMDSCGLVTHWNAQAEKMFGYPGGQAIGNKLAELIIPPADRAAHCRGLQYFLETGVGPAVGRCVEVTAMRSDTSEFPAELSVVAVPQKQGVFFSAFVRDITERKRVEHALIESENRFRQLADYDPLTGLPNRRLLNDRLWQAMVSSKRSGQYCALMFLDLDNFKPLNDAHKHDAGDLLLIEVAQRITACVREVDTVARFGGDEFVVIISDLDVNQAGSLVQAGIVAEKIRSSLGEPYVLLVQHGGEEETIVHHCTASIGVVLFINHETDPDDIIKWADSAMYQAKESGRNTIRVFNLPPGSSQAAGRNFG